jgi:hypothetical protein
MKKHIALAPYPFYAPHPSFYPRPYYYAAWRPPSWVFYGPYYPRAFPTVYPPYPYYIPPRIYPRIPVLPQPQPVIAAPPTDSEILEKIKNSLDVIKSNVLQDYPFNTPCENALSSLYTLRDHPNKRIARRAQNAIYTALRALIKREVFFAESAHPTLESGSPYLELGNLNELKKLTQNRRRNRLEQRIIKQGETRILCMVILALGRTVSEPIYGIPPFSFSLNALFSLQNIENQHKKNVEIRECCENTIFTSVHVLTQREIVLAKQDPAYPASAHLDELGACIKSEETRPLISQANLLLGVS